MVWKTNFQIKKVTCNTLFYLVYPHPSVGSEKRWLKMEQFNIDKKPWLSILIHSDSINNPEEISTFIELNNTEYVEIDVTPTDNQELLKLYSKKSIQVPTYDTGNGHIVMKYDNGFKNARFLFPSKDDYLSHCSSKLTAEDIIFSSSYDFFITDLIDPYFKKRKIKNAQSIEYVKNIIRIIFSNNNIYLYRPNFKINEGYYYLMRFKTIFSCYQDPWSIIVHSRDENKKVFDNMASLSTRLVFICKAYEKTAYFTLLKVNNDTFDNLLYHLGYFIMLCTGAFDDLAWIIMNLYEIRLSRMQIALKQKKFKDKIEMKNPTLFKLLNNEDFITKLESFYPIRDALQHRNFLSGYTVHGGNETSHMIYLDPEAAKSIDDKYLRNFHDGNNETISISPRNLIEIMYERVISIVHQVYACIDWDYYKNKLPDEDKKKVIASTEKFKQGIGDFFDFPGNPMYI